MADSKHGGNARAIRRWKKDLEVKVGMYIFKAWGIIGSSADKRKSAGNSASYQTINEPQFPFIGRNFIFNNLELKPTTKRNVL